VPGQSGKVTGYGVDFRIQFGGVNTGIRKPELRETV
jgi:hypothetical protein